MQGSGLVNIINTFGTIINSLVPIAAALALLAFFWGLAMYLFNFSGEDKDKKKGRDLMIYGILALFIMVSVWGIAQLLQSSLGISNTTQLPAPSIQQ